MHAPRHPRRPAAARASQRGAVLYVSMVMLVLLALIGVVGAQVAGLQERMSSGFRAMNLAFQLAEEHLRSSECGLQKLHDVIGAGGCPDVDPARIGRKCQFDPAQWKAQRSLSEAGADAGLSNIDRIEDCLIAEESAAMGSAVNEGRVVYRITTYRTDAGSNDGRNTAAMTTDSVYRL